jgi:hyperosmotically inducible protein
MKSNRLKQIASLLALLATAGALESQASSQATAQNREAARLAREVRHELLTLPWYGVFDWLEGSVTADGRVTLRGWVVSPTTRSDAENRVREIEGVQQLSNEIRVLPVSPNDERLRRAVYEALFGGNSPLFRYALGSNPRSTSSSTRAGHTQRLGFDRR